MPASTATLFARIPYGPRQDSGRPLEAKSIVGMSGKVPACWRHWAGDNYVFTNPALWVKDADGIGFIHTVDLSQPQELAVYELALAGVLGVSYGQHGTEEETRLSVAIASGQPPQTAAGGVLPPHPLRHMSYGRLDEVAFQQPPVKILFEV